VIGTVHLSQQAPARGVTFLAPRPTPGLRSGRKAQAVQRQYPAGIAGPSTRRGGNPTAPRPNQPLPVPPRSVGGGLPPPPVGVDGGQGVGAIGSTIAPTGQQGPPLPPPPPPPPPPVVPIFNDGGMLRARNGFVDLDLLAYLHPYALFRTRDYELLMTLRKHALVWKRDHKVSDSYFSRCLSPTVAEAFIVSELERVSVDRAGVNTWVESLRIRTRGIAGMDTINGAWARRHDILESRDLRGAMESGRSWIGSGMVGRCWSNLKLIVSYVLPVIPSLLLGALGTGVGVALSSPENSVLALFLGLAAAIVFWPRRAITPASVPALEARSIV